MRSGSFLLCASEVLEKRRHGSGIRDMPGLQSAADEVSPLPYMHAFAICGGSLKSSD